MLQERDTISSVLVRLGSKVDAPATKTPAPHLEITSYLTDQIAAPGTHFSIVLDIRPADRVHVYAPGVSGYKPIGLTVQPQAGLAIRDPQRRLVNRHPSINLDRIVKFDPPTERFTEYLLPTRGTEIRQIQVDNRTNPPTVWAPYNRQNKIVRLQFRTPGGSGTTASR